MPAGRRIALPDSGIGIVFQHSRPLHRQTVLENIKLALLPDSLLRLVAEPHVDQRAREIAERVGLGAVIDRRPPTLPFADLRRLEMAKALARDPQVVLVDEPFAGLTLGEVAVFSELIDGFRRDGRAVLLVDHNVKSVAALVDRVLAMYLGAAHRRGHRRRGYADETVRRVYIGGKIEAHPRKELDVKGREALLEVRGIEVFYGKAQALQQVSIHVNAGEFVSVVGTEWRRQDDAVQRDLRPGAVHRRYSLGGRQPARTHACADRPRGNRAMPGDARAVRRSQCAREP